MSPKDRRTVRGLLRSALSCSFVLATVLGAAAAEPARYTFDIPAEPLADALSHLAASAHLPLIFKDGQVAGRMAPALHGSFTADAALAHLLRGTGLRVNHTAQGSLVIVADAASRAAQSPPAAAQTAQDEKPEEIVVTANKREERLRNVANSISAISQKTLTERQLTDFAGIATQIPSLALQDTGDGRERLILRGLNSGGASANVGILVDDVILNYASGLSNGGISTANLDTYDMQRVEVLRGPQGALYGGAAEAGLIKFVTNPPNPNKWEEGVEFGTQGVSGGGVGWNTKAFLNMPIVTDTAAFRVSGTYQDIPGYIDDVLTGRQEVNRSTKYSVRPSLLFDPTDELDIRVTYFKQHDTYDSTGIAEVLGQNGGAPFGNVPLSQQFNLANGGRFVDNSFLPSPSSNDYSYTSLVVKYDSPWGRLTSATSFGQLKDVTFSDASSDLLSPGLAYSTLASTLFGQPVSPTLQYVQAIDKWNQEIRLTSLPGTELFGHDLDLQGGFFYTHEDINYRTAFDVISRATGAVLTKPFAGGGANLPGTYKEYSFFGDAVFHFNSSLDVEIGGRRTQDDQFSQVTNYPGFTTGLTQTKVLPAVTSNETAYTWSVAPRWHIDSNSLAYIRIASGYRPGGPEVPIPNPPPGFPSAYGSDSTVNYEIGFRSSLLNRRLSVDVAAFYIDWTNIQILTVVQPLDSSIPPYNVTGNAGTAVSQGLEWNFNYEIIDGLTAGLIGALTDAHLTRDAPGLAAHGGDALAFVPNISNTFNLDYRWRMFDDYNAYIGASVIYVGNRTTNAGISAFETHVKLPNYTTVNAQFGFTKGRYTLEVFGQNLSDTRGVTSFDPVDGYNFTGKATFIRPLTVGARVGATF